MAFRDQPLGELALTIPRASALFRQYDMDYCCGGKQTLERAASRKELDVAVIEAELAKLAEEPVEKDWRARLCGNHRPYHRSLSRPAPRTAAGADPAGHQS
jgi:iron-sulfur cluster repair protein YtfE (RIC family)